MDSSPDSVWFDGAGDSQSCWITSGPKSRWWVLAPRAAASRESVAEQMGSKMGHPNSDRLAMISFMFATKIAIWGYTLSLDKPTCFQLHKKLFELGRVEQGCVPWSREGACETIHGSWGSLAKRRGVSVCEMGCPHENAIDKNVWPLIFQYSYMGVSGLGVCPANGYLILNW